MSKKLVLWLVLFFGAAALPGCAFEQLHAAWRHPDLSAPMQTSYSLGAFDATSEVPRTVQAADLDRGPAFDVNPLAMTVGLLGVIVVGWCFVERG